MTCLKAPNGWGPGACLIGSLEAPHGFSQICMDKNQHYFVYELCLWMQVVVSADAVEVLGLLLVDSTVYHIYE